MLLSTTGEAGLHWRGDGACRDRRAGGGATAEPHAARLQRLRLLRGLCPELHQPAAAAAEARLLQVPIDFYIFLFKLNVLPH